MTKDFFIEKIEGMIFATSPHCSARGLLLLLVLVSSFTDEYGFTDQLNMASKWGREATITGD